MRLVGGVAVALALLLGVALVIGGLSGSRIDSYYLDILNSGKDEAVVRVSGCTQTWRLAPGAASTFEVTQQPAADDHKEREFTVESAGKKRTLRSAVDYGRHIVLDVTGDDCIVAADYGAQYRPKDMKLPEGMRDITVVKIFRHQPLFLPSTFDTQKASTDINVKVGLGDKLPDKIEVSTRSTRSLHEVVRLVRVPCDIVDNERALYNYLHDH